MVASCIATFGWAAGAARADSRYSAVRVDPLKGKGGAVVGAVIKLRLHSSSSYHNVVWIGLMPSIKKESTIEKTEVQNPRSKKWVHHFAKQTGMTSGEVRELELTIRYDETPHLVPGEDYQIATTWGAKGDRKGDHVFGVNWGGRTTWGEPEITLPEKKAPERPAKKR